MSKQKYKPNPVNLARELFKFRKGQLPFGYYYAVKVRLGHAWVENETALAEILSGIDELGYEIVRKKQ
ncbi:MAG: hypothetical protein OXE53_18970 [Deltaproteobacteria bacterium]|nr:hypothetical protein [Deltaproteobacteria bacterium]